MPMHDARQNHYMFVRKGLKAIQTDDFMPHYSKILPVVYMRPTSTVFDGYPTQINSWKSMGEWIYRLLEGMQQLPLDAVEKVKSVVADIKTDREKVEALYNYLNKTTRYVSIQLGIGGYRPMSATEVYRTGFGDCKALSNYMKAMLDVIGISSVYSVIRSSDHQKDVYPNYANFQQFNHVVLQVPLPNDTLWLECTNPNIPLGYVHNSIAGNDVLLVTPNGGVLKRTPANCHTNNVENNVIKVKLMSDGSANIEGKWSLGGSDYERNAHFVRMKPIEQIDFMRKNIQLPHFELQKHSFKEQRTVQPQLNIYYSGLTNNYGSGTGKRLFVPVSVFSKLSRINFKERSFDIVQNYGYVEADSVEIEIPDGFVVENLTHPLVLESDFGLFLATVRLDKQKIYLHQQLQINPGSWHATRYREFVDFRNKISDYYKNKIVLKNAT
jgi:hypothetical protein